MFYNIKYFHLNQYNYWRNIFIYFFLALIVLSWKNSVDEAFEFLEQAIKIDPKCDYAYETLGTLYIQS